MLVSALTGKQGVTVGSGKRGFGSGTLQVNGRIFAMVAGGRIVLKLSATRVAELVAAGYWCLRGVVPSSAEVTTVVAGQRVARVPG